MPVHMMGIHPIRGMEHSPMPVENMHHGIVTGIPTNIVGASPNESAGLYAPDSHAMRNPHMSPMPHHLMSQGLPSQQPQVSGRETYATMSQSSMPVEATPSFSSVDSQRLRVGGMQNVQDTISLVSVSEALEQLSQSPTQQQAQQSNNGSRTSPARGQERTGALWS